jgi:hypothetical protein
MLKGARAVLVQCGTWATSPAQRGLGIVVEKTAL